MNSLRGEVYGFIRANCFILGKILLTACDRPFQCSLETAIDPDREIEMMAIATLKQEDTFQNNDIYVLKGVGLEMLWSQTLAMAGLGGSLFGVGMWRFRRQFA